MHIGGGFGGLNVAQSLGGAPVEVTLIDKRNFHLFQPLLYQVATGGLSPGDIAFPLRSILRRHKNVTVLLEEVTSVDPDRRIVHTAASQIPYDILVLAAGSESHYFGHPEWAEFAPTLKTIEDATEIRRRILIAFENAECESDPALRREWLRFVVVGAGPTGVELSGAIAEIARDTLRGDFRRIHPEESEILLIDGGTRVLSAMQPDLSEDAERSLIALGVRPRMGIRVTSIDAAGLSAQTPQGEQRIPARTILWAAGVRTASLVPQLAKQLAVETDRMGRIPVTADLSVAGHPNIFVIGDAALFLQDGNPLPGMSPVAMQQGWYVAKQIAAKLNNRSVPPFHYVNKGVMATVGRKAAVVDLGFVRFGGVLAWLAWLFLHLLYLVTFRSRLSVALQWAFQYFTFNRGARLITQDRYHKP